MYKSVFLTILKELQKLLTISRSYKTSLMIFKELEKLFNNF